MRVEKDSFLKGAFILMVAMLATRVIGVFQRIPLYRIIGSYGAGLYTASYDFYAIILALSSTGINVAVAKMVAERMALGDEAGARRVFRLSAWLLAFLGLFFAVLFYAASPFLSGGVFKNAEAYYSFVAVAPAIFLVALMAPYRGWFQGLQNMTPYAISLVVEQLGRVFAMLALAYLLLPRGIPWAAAGAAGGAAAGAVAGLIYLVGAYYRGPSLRRRRERPESRSPGRGTPESVLGIIRQVIDLSIPISLASIVLQLFMIVDTAVVPARLVLAGYTLREATSAFGQLKTPAFTLVNLPTVLTSAIFASLVPAISESLALERMDRIRAQSAAAIRITLLFTIPALVGLYLLASEIQALLFNDPSAGVVTRALSAAIIFLPLQMSSSAILQGMGKMMAPVTNLVIGGLIKLGITWLLAANPAFGINGAAYGSVAGFIVAAALNLTMAQSLIGAVFNWIEMVVKPIIAAAFMGLGVRALYNWSYLLVPSNSLATLIGVGAGAAIYGLVLLLIGGIRAGDLELVPRVGPRLAVILKKLRLVRD